MKKKMNKENIFMTVLVIVLVGIFAVLFTYGLNSVLAMEGAYPPNVLTEGITPAPTDKAEAVAFLNNIVNKALEDKPKLDNNHHFILSADSVTTTGSDELRNTFVFLAEGFGSQLDGNLENTAADYGEDMADKLNIPKITPDNVIDFNCDYIYYACPSCGAQNGEQLEKCEACGSTAGYNMQYRDEYFVAMTLIVDDGAFGDNFTKRTNDEAIALCGDTLKKTVKTENLNIEYTGLRVVYRVERMTNNLKFLEYEKFMTVSADATVLGKFEALGSVNLTFDITECDTYNFTWPKISLSSHEISVEPKGSNNIQATLICADPLNTAVTWTSSDESIVTVDEEGYFKAGKTPGEAVITAEFLFGGKTYKDECVIKVKYSVESSKISDKKLELNAGETKELKATVSPKSATIQTVKWYSENEDIATVDENGVVTAVSSGKAVVYSLTDDGYYKSSCEVTVK